MLVVADTKEAKQNGCDTSCWEVEVARQCKGGAKNGNHGSGRHGNISLVD